MANSKISALPVSTTPLAGTEVLPIVQSSATKQVSVANLTAGRAISATQLTLTTGNVIVANGQGIDFSATPGTGTSELLNDYEEGAWTPVVTADTGSITAYTSLGTYTKVGRLVQVVGNIVTTTVGTAAGKLNIAGLPFTINNFYQGGLTFEAVNSGIVYFAFGVPYATTAFVQTAANGGIVWQNGSSFYFSFSYSI